MGLLATVETIRELSFITGRGGPSVCGGGGPEFFGVVKGGTKIFSVVQRGGPKFFEGQGGGDQNFFSIFFGPSAQLEGIHMGGRFFRVLP